MTFCNADQPTTFHQPGLHVAIIMDGSGRWAVARGLQRTEGHRAGRAAVRRTIMAARAQGIHALTLFTFSTDNWGRPDGEVAELMRVFEGFFLAEAPALVAQGIRISVTGRRDRLPEYLRDAIEMIELMGAENGALQVRLAIDYSGRDAILAAASRFQPTSLEPAEHFSRLLEGREHPAE